MAFWKFGLVMLAGLAACIASAQDNDRAALYKWFDDQSTSIGQEKLMKLLFLSDALPKPQAEFEKSAKERLDLYQKGHKGIFLWRGYGPLQALALARESATQKLPALERQLFNLAEEIHGYSSDDKATGLKDDLKAEIMHLKRESLYWDLTDRAVPTRQVAQAFNQWIAEYPRQADTEINKDSKVVQAMTADEEKHPKVSQAQLDAMPADKKAAELIYRLRDVQTPAGGMPSIGRFAYYEFKSGEREYGVASQLVQMGLTAVPSLLDALSDRSFTRTFRDMMFYPGKIVRVQDAAVDILEAIACRSFGPASGFENERNIDDESAQVRAWYKEVKERGEAPLLAQIIESRENNTIRAAQRLSKIDPVQANKSIHIALDRFGKSAEELKQFLVPQKAN